MVEMIRAHRKESFPSVFGRRRIKAQASLEYALIVICIVAALLAMRFYITRGMQGRLKQVADELGQQYSPKNTAGNFTMTSNSVSRTEVMTLSEQQLTMKHGYDIDLDGDGVIEPDVYATETISYLGRPVDLNGDGVIEIPDEIVGGATTTQTGGETVGPLP